MGVKKTKVLLDKTGTKPGSSKSQTSASHERSISPIHEGGSENPSPCNSVKIDSAPPPEGVSNISNCLISNRMQVIYTQSISRLAKHASELTNPLFSPISTHLNSTHLNSTPSSSRQTPPLCGELEETNSGFMDPESLWILIRELKNLS